MKASIIVFPGTNREKDMAMALSSVTGTYPDFIWHKNTDIGTPDLIVLPGGFSYGDYLRCGAMAANSPVMKEVVKLAHKGTPILGVCNGFQMLLETQLLPGALLRNDSLRFICKNVYLKTENAQSLFTNSLDMNQYLKVPVAHGEGNYFADDDTLKYIQDNDMIAFTYCDENGKISQTSNPNGSRAHIAGILNENKTILGMMPHPENATQIWQDNQSGLALFESIVKAI